jgi:hypothetical protein
VRRDLTLHAPDRRAKVGGSSAAVRLQVMLGVMPQDKMMTDSTSTLHGLCQESKDRDGELRNAFAQLEETLSVATKGVDLCGTSDNRSLENYGDDEAIYGHLFFSGSVLQVAYRSTEEDVADASDGDRYEPTFSVTTPRDCRAVWLRALAAPAVVESLLNSVTNAVRISVDTASAGVRVLSATANIPVRDLESAFVSAAEKLNYLVVLEDWHRAQSALGVDPADAATRACRLLESLCKHILQTRNQPLPADQKIQKLFRAAARSLNLTLTNKRRTTFA